jgi:RNA polymerase sigma factor (sigma-70 family)
MPQGNDLSDIELVDQLLRGVPDAFEIFLRRYQRLIYHCICKKADAPDDVDELIQSFFERLIGRDYRILKLWQRGTSLPVYLSAVIRNFVADYNRAKRSRHKKTLSLDELLEDNPQGKASEERLNIIKEEDITSAIEHRELRKLGIRAWAKLEERDRFIICSKLHRDLDNNAIAERLKLASGALRTALSRAQNRLLAGLKTLAPEYFPA